jgi:hypothetical protein
MRSTELLDEQLRGSQLPRGVVEYRLFRLLLRGGSIVRANRQPGQVDRL